MPLLKVNVLHYFLDFNVNFLHFTLIELEFNFQMDFLFFKTIWATFVGKNLKMIINIIPYLQHFFVNMGPNMDFCMNFAKIDLLKVVVLINFGWGICSCCLKIQLLFFFCLLLHFGVFLNCFIFIEQVLCVIFLVFNRCFEFSDLFFNHLRILFTF